MFDLFEGPSIGEGKKSIAIEVSIQPVEKTLTDEDFEALAGKIVENVKKQTGGVLGGESHASRKNICRRILSFCRN